MVTRLDQPQQLEQISVLTLLTHGPGKILPDGSGLTQPTKRTGEDVCVLTRYPRGWPGTKSYSDYLLPPGKSDYSLALSLSFVSNSWSSFLSFRLSCFLSHVSFIFFMVYFPLFLLSSVFSFWFCFKWILSHQKLNFAVIYSLHLIMWIYFFCCFSTNGE